MKKTLLFHALILISVMSFGQTVQSFTPAKDNSIFSDQFNNANGQGPLFSGQTCFNAQRRALMQFDLSSIPTDAVINSVTLEVDCNLVSRGGTGAHVYTLHALTQDWGEGSSSSSLGLGATAVAPDATWINAMTGGATWSNIGGDFVADDLTSLSIPLSTGTYTFPTASNFVAAVQAWVNTPASNFGMIMIGNENSNCTARRFGSKDSGTAPKLTVTYTSCTPSNGTDTQVACDAFTWIDGNTYITSNNTATFNIAGGAASGCDSLVTLNLTLNNSATGTDTQVACDAFTWIDGNTYTTSNNTATFNIAGGAANGCDSLVTLNLTLNNSAAGTDTQVACDAFTWIDGNTYTSSNGSSTFNFPGGASNGCDSMVTLDLTIINSSTSNDTQVACDSYTWLNGTTYTISNNTATFNIPGGAANGCDSVVTLDLTINNSNTGTDTQVACDEYSWIDGNTYFASNNVATQTLTNSVGCDSVVTLDLTISNANPIFMTLNPIKDNSIYSESNNSNGMGSLFSGSNAQGNQRRALMQFDLSSLPAGAIITNASLELTVEQYSGNASSDYKLHSLITDWGEGTSSGGGSGAPAVAPDATWSDAMFGTMTWTDPGGDFVSTPSNTTTFTNTTGVQTMASTGMVDDLNNWLATPANNYGWILVGDEGNRQTARRMGSKDAGTAPALTVGYILPNEPDTISITACELFETPGGIMITASGLYNEVLTGSTGCDSTVVFAAIINSVDVSTATNGASITASADGASYQWLDCDNNNAAIAGATSQTFTATENGNYAVEVTQNGCTDTSACVAITVVSVVDLGNEISIMAFPNPTSNLVNIAFERAIENVELTLRDVRGNVLSKQQYQSLVSETVELSDTKGIYFLTIRTPEGSTVMKLLKN